MAKSKKRPMRYPKKHLVLFALMFALLGVAALRFSLAGAPTRPVRTVILVPKDMKLDDTAKAWFTPWMDKNLDTSNIRKWYCDQVGACYDDGGSKYVFIQGSLTTSQYLKCPNTTKVPRLGNINKSTYPSTFNASTIYSDPCVYATYRIMWNVALYDQGSVYRDDMDTLIVPAWDNKDYANTNLCIGASIMGGSLAIANPWGSENCPLQELAAHEIGHTFGLAHNNSPTSTYTPWDVPTRFCGLNSADPYTSSNGTTKPSCGMNADQISYLRGQSIYFPPVAVTATTSSTGGTTTTSGGTTTGSTGGSTGSTTTYTPSWKGLENLGGSLASGPAVASWGSGHLDVFYKGTDNALWHKYMVNGVWYGPESLGGVIKGEPAAVSWGYGRVDVFAIGTDYQMYHRWYDTGSGGWMQWEALGGYFPTGTPAVTSIAPGHLDIFSKGSDNNIYHKWFYSSSGWGSWGYYSLGGPAGSSPVATSWGNPREDIVVRCSDNYNFCHRAWTGGDWYPWDGVGSGPIGQTYFTPALTSAASDRLNLFSVMNYGGNLTIYEKKWTGSDWTGWSSVGVTSNASPAATGKWGGGRVDLFFRNASNNGLWHIYYQ